ncbi:hypothetical protein EVAR_82303_1 [Eumeta japonica]|uniref:Uncharacterized protein n=1 Tax=Eumeta variegata TaxID=151549 RepID=A0A4C1VZ56_EUMVA|nr:hypothetical protein EVAR_82303_1 [Eumeta japonica]
MPVAGTMFALPRASRRGDTPRGAGARAPAGPRRRDTLSSHLERIRIRAICIRSVSAARGGSARGRPARAARARAAAATSGRGALRRRLWLYLTPQLY